MKAKLLRAVRPSPRILVALTCLLAAALLLPAAAAGRQTREEQKGQALDESVRSMERRCSDLSTEDFELIGEYAMGRYLADPAAHEAMNRRMTRMMGAVGERRMHVALGYRYAGCRGGPAWGWMGPMAGMMHGHYGGGESGGSFGPGMMGGNGEGEGHEYRGSMMGSRHRGGDGIGDLGVVLVALAAAAIGAGIAVLVLRRRGPDDRMRITTG
jgi:hypothetical protein